MMTSLFAALRPRHPAELLDLLAVDGHRVVTATGLVFELFDVVGPDAWHAPRAALDLVQSLLEQAAAEVVDHTLLQFVVMGDSCPEFFERYDALPNGPHTPINALRRLRRGFLKSDGFFGTRLVLAVGVRRKLKIEAAYAACTEASGRIQEIMARAGLNLCPVGDVNAIYARGVLPHRVDESEPQVSDLLSLREQFFTGELPDQDAAHHLEDQFDSLRNPSEAVMLNCVALP